ncbi:DUF6777 domain-containing protein [Streptomyces fungicidicus]|uniref:DUF6777 domain-containing protein n=1 Tax=Streptomyces fungicidicus TaxID=68203 RepID=UPI00378F4745
MQAVAAGTASLDPFFDEDAGLGRDADVRSRPAHGGLQQGDTPGLYGGTGRAAVCDVEQLKRYLGEPRNDRKARAWAGALGLRTAEIPGYLDRLTPVLLRHDTLVRNHDYKKGKAVPFPALLQAGIAVLVDARGLPAVKCSCGNPLRPFAGDSSGISVSFDRRNKKWKDFDRSELVVVRPATDELERIVLVDVQDSGRGIRRPVGTTGEDDAAFDTRQRRAVPALTGTTFGEASRRLTARGLAVAYQGKEPPPDDARVTASDPAAGAGLRFGAHVTLSVAEDTRGGGAASPPDAEPSRPSKGPGSPPPSPPSSSSPPSSAGSPSGSSSGSGTPPSADPDPPAPPSTGAGPPPPDTPDTASAPPRTTSAPPASASVTGTTSAPPAGGGPASSAPDPSVTAAADRPRSTRE